MKRCLPRNKLFISYRPFLIKNGLGKGKVTDPDLIGVPAALDNAFQECSVTVATMLALRTGVIF
jgi:hypothetical protein